MPDSFDVFISYKREDQAFAETLRERLIAWGYTAWMDKYNIPAGAYWPDEIDRALNASQVVIGVLSPRAVASRNVKNEWDWSIVNGKRLLLLMIEPCVVPMNYVSINYIDCVKDQAAGLARLHAALTGPTPPPSPIDPYRDYLQALYDRINTYLAQTIIKVRPDDPRTPEPIQLRSERTRGAVDALFEKRDEIDPLFMIGGIRQEPVRLDGDFRKVFDYFDGRVLLLGEPGAGKTISLLHFGRDAVVQRIQDPTKPLPVLAIIPTWDAEKQTLLGEWLANAYGAPPDVARIVSEGRALLLLDGLDELGSEREEPNPEDTQKPKRYDPRQRFVGIVPANNQVIVTCRVKDYEEIGEKIALKGAVTLQQLTDTQIRDYLSAEVPDLWAALEADEELRDVARTPLLLSLFAFGYKDQGEETAKLRNLRESPGELRDAIFARYVRRRYQHEARKLQFRHPPEEMPFGLEEIYQVLGAAAMLTITKPKKEENILPPEYFDKAQDESRRDLVALAIRLHLLVREGKAETFAKRGISAFPWTESEDSRTLYFIHLLLRDHFGFRYALPLLAGMNPDARRCAAIVLGVVKDTRAVDRLIAAMDDPEAEVRSSAATALGEIEDIRAIDPLVVTLGDRAAQYEASMALAKIGKSAVPRLLLALHDRNTGWYAANTLGEIGDPAAVPKLVDILRNLHYDRDMRQVAAEALGKIGDPTAIPALIESLGDGDRLILDGADLFPAVYDYAVKALAYIGSAAIPELLNALNHQQESVRHNAIRVLGEIGGSQVVRHLIEILDHHEYRQYDGEAYIQVAFALEKIKNPDLNGLLTAMYSPSGYVRGIVARYLGQIGNPIAVPALIEHLGDKKSGEPNVWPHFHGFRVCDIAAQALSHIGTPEALAAVEAWRREQNKE